MTYGWNLLDFLFVLFLLHASFDIYIYIYIFLLEACYGFVFDNTHGLSFHFYLCNVRKENTFHFENFEKYFFVFYLLQFCCTIPNACRSLSSVVVHSNAKPKLFRCVTKLHQIFLPTRKDWLLFFHLFTTCSIQVPNGFPLVTPFFYKGITQMSTERVSIAIGGGGGGGRK
jgi:hypothetical protein